jgi:hypothetical protein
MATTSDQAAEAVEAYLQASESALEAANALRDAWLRYLRAEAETPTGEWIAEVAAKQGASDLALARACIAQTLSDPEDDPVRQTQAKVRRRRRKESPFLRSIGPGGQRMLRAAILIALLLSGLVAVAAGISLALEVAGFLHLIDDPVQLPVGVQLAVFLIGGGAALGLKKSLKPVERALYGSKGIRPKPYSL